MELKDRIRKSRMNKGLTQKQLAELLNVHVNSIKKYENKAIKLDTTRINEIADALDVSPNWLAFGITEEEHGLRMDLEQLEARNNFLKSIGFTVEIKQIGDEEFIETINGVEYNTNQLNILIDLIKSCVENTTKAIKESKNE